MRYSLFIFALYGTLFLMVGCSGAAPVKASYVFKTGCWNRFSPILFSCKQLDTTKVYAMVLDVAVDATYPLQSLSFSTTLHDEQQRYQEFTIPIKGDSIQQVVIYKALSFKTSTIQLEVQHFHSSYSLCGLKQLSLHLIPAL